MGSAGYSDTSITTTKANASARDCSPYLNGSTSRTLLFVVCYKANEASTIDDNSYYSNFLKYEEKLGVRS